ncbi:MAG: phospho-N-acetylmuramoyl-pentapeptide-transferase [Candidatus Komeilibacteria bacterium]
MIANMEIIRLLVLAAVAFIVAMILTPAVTAILYKYHLGVSVRDEGSTPIYSKLHKNKSGTPTMGGVIIWITLLIIMGLMYLVSGWSVLPGWIRQLNFFSRSETLLPLGVLVSSALVGLIDDIFNVRRRGGGQGGGMTVKHRLVLYTLIATVGALWFYFKLDWDLLHIPFLGEFSLGPWYILVFIFIIVATAFSVNETDGLDGLAGGVLLSCFASFAAIALLSGKYDLAAFCAVIIGGLLAFLWFNINPARFFMGDTGAMSLGITLGVVALLTQSALLLPVIGLVFLFESLSVIIQLTSKKLFKRKIFLSTPIHHHFEAIGWPEPKVVMRFWVISGVAAVLGLIIAILDKTL